MGVDCNNCENKGKCGTSIAIDLIRTGGKDAFVGCKSYAPKFFSVKCPNCDCIIHVDTTSKPQTNYDRIHAMNVEELAEWMVQWTDCYECVARTKGCCQSDESCASSICNWLKQEVE